MDRGPLLLRIVQGTMALGMACILMGAVRWAALDSSLLAASNGPPGATPAAGGRAVAPPSRDLALYEAEVQRMRAGEDYYRAAAVELHTRGYPTQSVFNWRQPWLAVTLAFLPHPDVARLILGALATIILLLGYRLLRQDGEPVPVACLWCVLTTLALLPGLMPRLYYSSELWAGYLMLLSVLLASSGRNGAAVVAGLAALFLRELALPFCLSAAAAAWMRGRRGECRAWVLAVATWGLFYVWHISQVRANVPPDGVSSRGWFCGGGIEFLLATAQMHYVLVLLPKWATVIYFGLATAGFIGTKSELSRRGAVVFATYVAVFAMVGQPFNQYWGQLWTPILCLGVTRSLAQGLRLGGRLVGRLRTSPHAHHLCDTRTPR